MDITGYTGRFSTPPGESLDFMISSRSPDHTAQLRRLFHGDLNPAGPGAKYEPVDNPVNGTHRGIEQRLHPGSYVEIPCPAEFGAATGSFTAQLWMWPTTPAKRSQTLLAWRAGGRAVELALRWGRPTLTVGDSSFAIDRELAERTWYFAVASYDARTGMASLVLDALGPTVAGLSVRASGPLAPTADPVAPAPAMITMAARLPASGEPVTSLFNGKLESPRLYRSVLGEAELDALRADGDPREVPGLLGAWDFAADISGTAVTDLGPSALHGRTRQRPTRAMTGHCWTGDEHSWRHAPAEYGAIHFHDDDLDDAGWDPTLRLTLPPETPSGVYSLRLETDGGADEIPFAVRPRTGEPTADVLLVLPTFSYLAYGNQHMLTDDGLQGMLAADGAGDAANRASTYPSTPEDRYIVDNRLHSLYDNHSDGSGVCYSSPLRPLVNMRPGYVEAALDSGRGSPHQFNADLHLIDWLRHLGVPVDVITDHDLYQEGRALLDPYQVVLTGTHHEYWSKSMLDALHRYLDDGGKLMYLSGNGMYWVTELDPERGGTIEIRRRGPSTRMWDARPGEGDLSFTGELGGLWRYRNRAPQLLLGVGFTAQGLGAGRPYRRRADSFGPEVSWIFEGVGEDELIGDFPCLVSGYGAAGFEIDRADHALGTPLHTHVLATADGFSDSYQHASEEVHVSDSAQGGSVNDKVRADMTYVEYADGGAVFSTGSITWCGCLSYDGYDNNVSRITRNVLERFLGERPAADRGRSAPATGRVGRRDPHAG
ncbi:N,N-dimethylformamidase beta subunit family domain-containing protein [Saccharopolyspora sp. MS10]|uniref:N,N-dimethylformamidase beta subunit family domain-containing protein n=1 Tax=Saccharopolyspora sp. MS10 TaxID=3385973 RepID=UPI0039A197EC